MEQLGPSADGFESVELHSPPAGATALSEGKQRSESPPGYSELFKKGSTETLDQFGKIDIIKYVKLNYDKYKIILYRDQSAQNDSAI